MILSFFRASYYRFGRPLLSREIFINGESVEKIYCRYFEKKETFFYKYLQRKQRRRDVEILKSYVLYYLQAPVFAPAGTRNKNFESISFEDLLDDCLDVGIDPF